MEVDWRVEVEVMDGGQQARERLTVVDWMDTPGEYGTHPQFQIICEEQPIALRTWNLQQRLYFLDSRRRQSLQTSSFLQAVTSAGSSELIAVSCLCTYDIYRILRVSREVVLGFGCFMGLLAIILNKAGVSLGWMYVTIGCVLGIITWLSVAKVEYGRVNLDTTGRNALMLAGNLVYILTGGAIHAVCSFLWPQNYDWDTTKQITMVEKEKSELPAEELKEEKLIRAKVWIVKWGVGFTVVIVLLWPLLSLPAGRFSEGYFTFWAIIAIAWGTIESAVIIVLPLTESWQTIQSIILGMFTNDRLMEKVEELNLKLHTIMLAIPEAERIYLLEKGEAKQNEA